MLFSTGASAIAGFFASACSLPFDYVKTQMQKMKPLPDGTLPYSSAMDCAAKTLKEGGPLKFYTGFPTYFVRIAPHAMVRIVSTLPHVRCVAATVVHVLVRHLTQLVRVGPSDAPGSCTSERKSPSR